MKFGYSRASATALVRTCVCPGTQFSQVNSQQIRYLDIFSKAQDSGFPRRRFTPNFFDIQKASVFTNPLKSGGGDVVEDLREELPAQGERTFIETSTSSLAGSKQKTNDSVPRCAMVRGSRGAAAKERKTLALRPYRDPRSCFPHLKKCQTSSARVFTSSSRGDEEPFS